MDSIARVAIPSRTIQVEDNEALTFTIRELAASKFVKYLALRTAIGENSEQILKATEPKVVQDLATENERLVVELFTLVLGKIPDELTAYLEYPSIQDQILAVQDEINATHAKLGNLQNLLAAGQ